jgi:zinc protease
VKKYLTLIITIFGFVTAYGVEVKLPPITEDTLSNGLVVVTVENHELPTATMSMIIKSGSAYDPQGKGGLADFTAGLLRQGTESKTATQIAEAIDFVGGSLDAGADRDAIRAGCNVLTKHFDVGLSLLSDIILHPSFDTTEIERQRKQVLGAIVQSKDDPNTLCDEGFDEFLFDGYPYGHPVEGTEQTVSAITRDDITTFYDNYFHPNNAFLVVAGDVTPDAIVPRISQAFSDWEAAPIPDVSFPEATPPQGYKILLINKPDATQTNIRFGHLGITRQNPDYYSVILMNYILGVGFTSRLTEEVRVKGGMTYDIRTTNDWNLHPAAYYCNTFTMNDSTMSAIRAAIKVIKGIQKAEVSDREYNDAVNFYVGYYPMSLETPSQVAGEIIKIKLYGLPVSYIQDFTKNIQKVTKADILHAAQKYIHPDDMVFCVVSNAAAVQDSLQTLGPVTVKSVDEM